MEKASGEVHYGRYVVRTFAVKGRVKARGFLGSKVVGDSEGQSHEDAVSAMKQLLDRRDAEQRRARRDGVPTAHEFADAFARLEPKLGEHHWLMLRAMLAAPGRTMTTAELAEAAGYTSYASGNEKFGRLARMIAEDLGYEPERRRDGTPIWTLTLATAADPDLHENDGLWRWTMRPEVVECLLGMNLGQQDKA